METVRSHDGTPIAYDSTGSGRPVILVGGAFSYRKFPKSLQLAELLAGRFTVINYDRRGRGDSGDTPPYRIESEIEDLEALLTAVGGSASLWGWSTGAVLALRAAAAGLPIERLALYEPPFLVDDSREVPPADFQAQLERLLADDRRGDMVKQFMTVGMGAPALFVSLMRIAPVWKRLTAVAHTLPYDWALLGDSACGHPLSPQWTAVTAPTLVMAGSKSPTQLRNAARALADLLPRGEHRELAGQSHNPSMKVQAPVIEQFLGSGTPDASDVAFPRSSPA